jgi:hypothetical protein
MATMDDWYMMVRVFDPEEGDGKKKSKHAKEQRRGK